MASGGIAIIRAWRISGSLETLRGPFAQRWRKGDVGIIERKKLPPFQEFSEIFMDAIRTRLAASPVPRASAPTERFASSSIAPCVKPRLDAIDEAMIERYVTARRRCSRGDMPPGILHSKELDSLCT